MAYSIMQQDNDVQYNVVQYVINTRDDLATVPTNCRPGSTVFIIEESSVLMLTVGENPEDREWKEI